MKLRLRNRKWYPLVCMIGSAVAISAWRRFPEFDQPELLLSAIGGVFAFTYFLYRQHLDETKLFKELFTDFNTRYDALNDDLNAILSGPADGSLSVDEKERLFSYFNLCAEEYFFYTAGYIDRHVWQAWHRGMKVFFSHPSIRALWEEDCTANSYYDFRPPQ